MYTCIDLHMLKVHERMQPMVFGAILAVFAAIGGSVHVLGADDFLKLAVVVALVGGAFFCRRVFQHMENTDAAMWTWQICSQTCAEKDEPRGAPHAAIAGARG